MNKLSIHDNKKELFFYSVNTLIILIFLISMLLISNNPNIWFDESYSIGLMKQSFYDFFVAIINDVHPILYYLLMKIYSLIFGYSIISLRIFSIIPIIILLIFSMTMFNKKYGKKMALIFNASLICLPVILKFAQEIRMYSYGLMFTTIAFFYFSEFINNPKTKNKRKFIIFSLLASYTHYYGFFAVLLMDFLFYIIKKRNKELTFKDIIKLFYMQIILGIPGVIVFLYQSLLRVGGFWISIEFPKIIFEIFAFPFNYFNENLFNSIISIILFILFLILFIFVEKKKGFKIDEKLTILLSILIPFIIISVILIISIIRPILIPRYTFIYLGMLIMTFSIILSKVNIFKNITFCLKINLSYFLSSIIILILVLGFVNNAIFYSQLYKKTHDPIYQEKINFINENIEEDDIFLSNSINTFEYSIIYENNNNYFYNKDNWNIEKAYKAYNNNTKIIYNANDLNVDFANIWIIDGDLKSIEEMFSDYEITYIYKDKTFTSFVCTAYSDTITYISKIYIERK